MFIFTNDLTNVDYAVICQDVSVAGAARVRSNLFDITEGVSDPTLSQVILGSPGVYHYRIYQQVSAVNLDPDNNSDDDIVERGFMRLTKTDESTSIYVENIIEVTYIAN